MVTALYGIGLVLALLAGGGIGLLLAMARYQRAAARRQRYEREVAGEAERRAARREALRRYAAAAPGRGTAAAP